MAVLEGRTWLEVLPHPRCWELLCSCEVGRVAFIAGGEPEVLPVTFVVDGESIVFRTDPGAKLDAVARNAVVAFEADHTEGRLEGGWSVVVKGHAEEIHRPEELRHVRSLPLRPWAQGEKSHWIRIVAREISGRRIVKPGPPG